MIESTEARQVERRYQAGRPYRRPKGKHQISSREDKIFTLAMTFAVGCMVGATLALGYLS